MQFKIGATLFIGENSQYHLSPSVQGLDSPAIRTGDGVYAGRDGGYISGHFYGQRTIVIPGFYIGSDCEDASNLRQTLLGYLRIRYALPIVITDFAGNNYYTEGFVKDIKSSIDNPIAGQFQITLLCPDPFLYILDGGLSEQYTWQNTTLVNEVDTTINNIGNVGTSPIFRFSGQLQNPTITNLTTQQSFSLDLVSPSGDLVIDMKKRLVLLDGDSISSRRTIDSTWWTLLPGQNDIRFENISGGSGVLSYQFGKAGI